MNPIYLDYNATTPVDQRVTQAILPYLTQEFGNPSSTHAWGKRAREAVELGRSQVARLIQAEPEEIIFTGGGTEASNQAILGTLLSSMAGFWNTLMKRRGHLIISSIEHPATSKAAAFASKMGCPVSIAPVDHQGTVAPETIASLIRPNTRLISIMHSNNEVGTLQPIREIASLAKKHGILVHTDAAQSTGKVSINVRELGVDYLTIAGHKLYAPKGIGVLFARKGAPLEPWIHGAGHENGKRAGTENVPYIAGLGAAAEICLESAELEIPRIVLLRTRLWNNLASTLGDRLKLNGHPTNKLPNTLHISILGCKGWEVLDQTPGVAASTGSACHEGKVTHSQVLCAMGSNREAMEGALRLSLGRFSTEGEVDEAARQLSTTALKLLKG